MCKVTAMTKPANDPEPEPVTVTEPEPGRRALLTLLVAGPVEPIPWAT